MVGRYEDQIWRDQCIVLGGKFGWTFPALPIDFCTIANVIMRKNHKSIRDLLQFFVHSGLFWKLCKQKYVFHYYHFLENQSSWIAISIFTEIKKFDILKPGKTLFDIQRIAFWQTLVMKYCTNLKFVDHCEGGGGNVTTLLPAMDNVENGNGQTHTHTHTHTHAQKFSHSLSLSLSLSCEMWSWCILSDLNVERIICKGASITGNGRGQNILKSKEQATQTTNHWADEILFLGF